MVRITEQLVRKKAEHNEGEISSLEELSLHQEDIEKIEHLQHWCRNIEILLLQNNLISRIENVHKLKRLKYLNLAINNIELIENLELCESLEKLDLTLNFIGNLESVCSLKTNYNLEDLYLTGNPCIDYGGYRSYVICKLPQIKSLDNKEISRSERLKAQQIIKATEKYIQEDQKNYYIKREEQRQRLNRPKEEISDEQFWKQKSEHAPEVRMEISNRMRKAKGKDKPEEKKEKPPVRLFTHDGRPLNINQAKVKFSLCCDDPQEISLDIAIYKFLDSTLLDVDLQPTYVKVIIKGKIFQIVFPEEICTSKSVAQRSQITGHLVIKMPKLNYKPRYSDLVTKPQVQKDISNSEKRQRREYLEIGTDKLTELCNIVDNSNKRKEFIDDPEVPPLE